MNAWRPAGLHDQPTSLDDAESLADWMSGYFSSRLDLFPFAEGWVSDDAGQVGGITITS